MVVVLLEFGHIFSDYDFFVSFPILVLYLVSHFFDPAYYRCLGRSLFPFGLSLFAWFPLGVLGSSTTAGFSMIVVSESLFEMLSISGSGIH